MRIVTPSTGWLLLVVTAACAAPPSAQPRSDAEKAQIEEMLFGFEDEWNQTALSRDPSALERILADDLVYTLDDGTVIGKQEMIDSWVDDPNTITSTGLVDLEAHWYGDDVVLVVGGGSDEGTYPDGNEFASSGRFTNVFVERDGVWQCIIGHFTETS